MKPIVALPFRHQATMFCAEARQMLRDAGFEIICNENGKKPSKDELKAMLSHAFAAVAGTETYDADILAAAPELKTIIRFGVGTDNFDLPAIERQGIRVGVIANYNSVAEFTLTLLLGLLKNLPRHDAAVRAGQWARLPMHDLSQKTVGIVGFGRIGKRLAELLSGFGVTILVYDPFVSADAIAQRGLQPVTLEALLQQSDVVSLHLPATPETRHLINTNTLALMKPTAYLVNTARGALVDEKALYQALTTGRLTGAALDVFESEPVTADNPLFALDNVVVAPHVAALSYETNYQAGITCAQSIIQVYRGGEPVYPLK